MSVSFILRQTEPFALETHRVSAERSAGVEGALPWIIMEAGPRVEDHYPQELAPGVAEDMAEVLSLKKSTTIAFGEFVGLLLTKEWTPLEPGVVEHKFYAEGIGFIRADMVKGGDEHTELVRITRLEQTASRLVSSRRIATNCRRRTTAAGRRALARDEGERQQRVASA